MITSDAFDHSITLLKELVQIDSVNPSLVPGGAGERQIASFLAAYLKQCGIDADLYEIADGRFNVIAKVDGNSPGPRILLNGHLDTVSVQGMQTPFEPVEREGRLYGRGAQDMKGGLASGISALLALASNRGGFPGELVLAAVADEEDQSLGTQHFLRNWAPSQPIDFAIVLEPTDLRVCTTHKGFAWFEIQTEGVAAHGSRPHEGVDAIRTMGLVLNELDRLNQQLQARPPHPLLGHGSLHASFIEGGREWSSYPDSCILKYERRTLPDDSEARMRTELASICSQISKAEPRSKVAGRMVCARSPFQVERSHPWVEAFYGAARVLLPQLVEWGAASFWTDAALLSQAGIPTVVFGPRGAGLHSTTEYVFSSDVRACAEMIYKFVSSK